MNINDLYKRLDEIFVNHTTHQWKNGWEHEGDRMSKELTLQKNIPWNNLFLLQKTHNYSYGGFSLDAPQGFKIEIEKDSDGKIRIDIETRQIANTNIYYYVDNELDWLASFDFIIDICQYVYDSYSKLKEIISVVPDNLYGEKNPQFTKSFRRERKLKELGIMD